MLSPTQLRTLYPQAEPAHLEAFAEHGAALFRRTGLDTLRQRCHFFLAQLGHESNGLQVKEENLNYSVHRLMQVWPERFPTVESAELYAFQPEKLGNFVYGGRMGNQQPEDGYRYRGRGYIQLTGREAYVQVGRRCGLPLETQPDLVALPEHALAVTCAFWDWKKLNALCDQGDFVGLTKRINGGLIGLQDRYGWLEKVQRHVPWQDPGPISLAIEDIKAVQQELKNRGLYGGSIDGILGPLSLRGVAILRAEEKLPPGGLDRSVLDVLGL
ncbi:hypothetical protein NON00_18955 [Roseomonas sp. GC11]|uniref:glycoside hydrolase family 19 protein n=1 Tax=Roseomonas sp. GC11 TaxID=2950546 RepID=UPI00210A0914|nr:glycoside hydrolase family 19 protein [Roseomonas sp. GC11]MCQ4161999.1 hypothetical protein [Roseomonas sp. GC11]